MDIEASLSVVWPRRICWQFPLFTDRLFYAIFQLMQIIYEICDVPLNVAGSFE